MGWITRVLTLFCLWASVAVCDEQGPDRFFIEQDEELRFFRVLENEHCIGSVLSSEYGVLDFYDDHGEKRFVNQHDALYDYRGRLVGLVKLASDTEWFWERKSIFQRSTHIDIFSGEEKLLATLDAEGDGSCFVLRDAVDDKPLAVALWSWRRNSQRLHFLSWIEDYVQNWEVMLQNWEVLIVDRARFQEDKMLHVFLVWALMKHSQKYFPDPERVVYLDQLPEN